MQGNLPQFTIGDYRLTLLPVGRFALDGGAMFGLIPKPLWEKQIPADSLNRIPLALTCLLIEHGEEKCILDTGAGNKFSPKYREIYDIRAGATIDALLHEALGIRPEAITKLLFTHLHFDHAGGATRYDESGRLVSTFPNAETIAHAGEWEEATHPTLRSRASYLEENLLPLRESGKLRLLEGSENEILPGLFLRVTGGHTKYHQVLLLDTPEGGFIYWGDLIPTRHHLKIPYVMAYDLYPVETMAMKEALLHEAVEKNWISVFEHDPDLAACRLAYNHGERCFSVGEALLPAQVSRSE